MWRFQYKKELTTRIATLTEEIEELQSERKLLLESMDCKDASQVPEVKKQADNLEKRLRALNQKTESLKQQRDSVLDQYDIAARDASNRFDPLSIYKARKDIRPEKEDEIKDNFGTNMVLITASSCWPTALSRQENCLTKKPRNAGLNGK